MTMPDDVAEQTRNIYATFAKVMREAGGELADIVRLRTFVTDAPIAKRCVKVQGEVFGAIRPAATIVVVSGAVEAGNEGRDRGRRAAPTNRRLTISRCRLRKDKSFSVRSRERGSLQGAPRMSPCDRVRPAYGAHRVINIGIAKSDERALSAHLNGEAIQRLRRFDGEWRPVWVESV